jgi:hypothetical protein
LLKKLILLVFSCLLCAHTLNAQTPSAYAQYLGRYTDGADYVVYFEWTRYGMTLRPALWTATQLLKQTGSTQFAVVDRTERGATFTRDERGSVTGVTIRGMEGEGLRLTRAGDTPLPIEQLLQGAGRDAAEAYLAQVGVSPTRILEAAERVLARFPSKASPVVDFLATAEPKFSSNVRLHTLLGAAHIAAGNRAAGLASFRRAYQLDPANKDAISGLARLQALPAKRADDKPWTLPFPLASVFKPPTPAEIHAVEADWRTRDLAVRGVAEVAGGRIKFGADELSVRIVSHLVNGQKHFGAIIAPIDATPSCCPVIVDVKGVSWNYFHLNLERLDSPWFMGEARRRFIYVVPSFRGEVMQFGGVSYQSEGDRTNAWDGATDDAIALLNAALQTTPAADERRICVFGRSRGGSVALLFGERDPRISCVVEWAGPTDWFELMGTEGWTQQELFAEGLRTRAAPSETGGQLVEHFLLKAVRGEEDLGTVRHRMLASSPLYFAKRLPRVQLHYGMEDTSVPVRNGLQLAARLKLPNSAQAAMSRGDERRSRSISRRVSRAGGSEAFFYPRQGHDTDRLMAPDLSRKFLIEALLEGRK